MSEENAPSDRQVRRDAQVIRGDADAAFERGDYKLAAALNLEIERTAAGTEAAQEAQKLRQDLRMDPVAIYSGAFAIAALLAGWVVALW